MGQNLAQSLFGRDFRLRVGGIDPVDEVRI
jgi:hypothetical protein